MLAWLSCIVLVLATLLGGATRAGFLGDVIVQLFSVPLLAVSVWSFPDRGQLSERQRRAIIFFACAVTFVIAIQLFPLPFEVPSIGGALTARTFNLGGLGQGGSWSSISATPQATWAAAASLVVPAAIFLAGVQLSLRQRLLLTWLILLLGGLGLLLGFAQMTQGPASGLRLYSVTNPKEAVGFFANRNHFAAQLYVTLVLAAAWYATTIRQTLRTGGLTSRSILWSAAAAVFLVSVVAGLAMARSRAGVFLAMVALAGIILMVLRRADREHHSIRRGLTVGRMFILAVLFAVIFAVQFGLGNVLSRFEGDQLEDLRVPLATTTFEAALRSLPFGTGLGSFVPVYAVVRRIKTCLLTMQTGPTMNLRRPSETGVFGLILTLAFLVWFFPKAYDAWNRRKFNGNNSRLLLQRASALIIFLLLAHSVVDYPLRTTALSSIFAFFFAVLATEAPVPKHETVPHTRRRFVDRKPLLHVTPGEKWGSELPWPESWQKRA